jgi:hypothetical protein
MNSTLKDGKTWSTVGIVTTLILSFTGWGYTLGVAKGKTDENARNISTLTTNVQTIAVNQTTLSVEMARTAEAIRALTASMDRVENDIRILEGR